MLVELTALALALHVVGVPLYPSLIIAVGAAMVLELPQHRTFTFALESWTVVRDDVCAEPA